MVTKQDIVLRAIYWRGKEVIADELMKDTSLTRNQIKEATRDLSRRHLITKRTEQPGMTNGKWHSKKSFMKIELKQIEFVEGYLRKRGLI